MIREAGANLAGGSSRGKATSTLHSTSSSNQECCRLWWHWACPVLGCSKMCGIGRPSGCDGWHP